MAKLVRLGSAVSAGVSRGRFGWRSLSGDGHVKDMGGTFKDRESAFENAYFNKEEQLKMETLIKKMRRQIEPTAAENAADQQALKDVLGNHKITASDAVVRDLMKWRFGK